MTDHQHPTAKPEGEGAGVDDAALMKWLRKEAQKNKAKRSEQTHGAHFVTRARKLNQAADRIAALSASPPVPAVAGEVRRMREVAQGWRRPGLEQIEGPNDLKIYGGTIADDIDRWADLLAARPTPSADQSGLHPATADLVDRFAVALKDKLAKAEAKYGYTDGWLSDDWQDDLKRKLREHVFKGDPRDVAAYCAFAWHHGWSVGFDHDRSPPLHDLWTDRGDGRPKLTADQSGVIGALVDALTSIRDMPDSMRTVASQIREARQIATQALAAHAASLGGKS